MSTTITEQISDFVSKHNEAKKALVSKHRRYMETFRNYPHETALELVRKVLLTYPAEFSIEIKNEIISFDLIQVNNTDGEIHPVFASRYKAAAIDVLNGFHICSVGNDSFFGAELEFGGTEVICITRVTASGDYVTNHYYTRQDFERQRDDIAVRDIAAGIYAVMNDF